MLSGGAVALSEPLPAEKVQEAARGGYVLEEASSGMPKVILIATGSEVSLALKARTRLEDGRRARGTGQHRPGAHAGCLQKITAIQCHR